MDATIKTWAVTMRNQRVQMESISENLWLYKHFVNTLTLRIGARQATRYTLSRSISSSIEYPIDFYSLFKAPLGLHWMFTSRLLVNLLQMLYFSFAPSEVSYQNVLEFRFVTELPCLMSVFLYFYFLILHDKLNSVQYHKRGSFFGFLPLFQTYFKQLCRLFAIPRLELL